MPDLTMASAMPRTSSSLTLQPNLFQVFHPMGGVSAKPLETALGCARPAALNDETIRIRESNFLDIFVAPLDGRDGVQSFLPEHSKRRKRLFDNLRPRF